MSQVLEIRQTSTLAAQNRLGASVRQADPAPEEPQGGGALKGHLPISRRLNDEGRAKRDRYAASELAGALFPNLPSF